MVPAILRNPWESLRRAVRSLDVRTQSRAGRWFAYHYLQPEAELDQGFRTEIENLSVAGLRTIGAITLLFAVMTSLVKGMFPASRSPGFTEVAIGTCLLGLAAYAASCSGYFRSSARLLGSTLVLLLTTVLMGAAFLSQDLAQSMAPIMGLHISLVMLITLVSLPLHPIHATRLAVAQLAVFGLFSLLAARSGAFDSTLNASVMESFAAMLFVMVLSVALSAAVYRRTFENYLGQTERLRLAEQMRAAQARALVAQNAAVLGRLAAALSHELNSPIAVINSGVETLDRLWEMSAETSPAKQTRLRAIRKDLSASVRDAATRMQQVVKRMQRFSNLDGADVLPVDINAVLSDVTALLSPEQRRRSRVELDLQVVPETIGRPEQINRAFESLIHGLLQQAEQQSTLRIRTRAVPGSVAVTMDYENHDATAPTIGTDLDLTFKVNGSRMAADNWDLVTARQIIEEHAGEIQLQHQPNGGIHATVLLPTSGQLAPADQLPSAGDR